MTRWQGGAELSVSASDRHIMVILFWGRGGGEEGEGERERERGRY